MGGESSAMMEWSLARSMGRCLSWLEAKRSAPAATSRCTTSVLFLHAAYHNTSDNGEGGEAKEGEGKAREGGEEEEEKEEEERRGEGKERGEARGGEEGWGIPYARVCRLLSS